MEIPYGPTVGDDHSGKFPFVTEFLLEKRMRTRRFAVQHRVRPHHGIYMRFAHSGLERRQIGFLQVFRTDDRIEVMPYRLRPAVRDKMFHAGCRFQNAFISLGPVMNATAILLVK